jgi:hypothetical protein
MADSITPPSELLKQWEDDWFEEREHADVLLIQAFQAGADQELEACCEWLGGSGYAGTCFTLRSARRPKLPSLKEQALIEFDSLLGDAKDEGAALILRALEALPE